jgi:hypothetical protein
MKVKLQTQRRWEVCEETVPWRNQNILSTRPRQTPGLLTKQSGSGNNENAIHVYRDRVEGLTCLPNTSPPPPPLCYYILTLGSWCVCDHLTAAVKNLLSSSRNYKYAQHKAEETAYTVKRDGFGDPSELCGIIVSQFPSAKNHFPFLFA